ncbi:syndecan-4-like isoform X1 [Sphaeramia orbicularis]|uniref:syndecan-4-like isoform X1 n=1 Tax=Sphaeramia orbicularis TaxID=375764 RepID=UPI00117C68CE|nr:syndecan-4-like isoform X1 [Sphaeramia orbicularis]
MRILLTAILMFLLGIIHPVSTGASVLPDDLEGSGYDDEGSGSGALSEKVSLDENKNDKSQPNTKGDRRFTVKAEEGSKDDFYGFSDRAFDGTHWSAGETIVAKSKTVFENKETLAGIIAGGVTGLVMAIILAGVLIYKWQKKDDGGYILGQQRASDEDCHRSHGDEIVVV